MPKPKKVEGEITIEEKTEKQLLVDLIRSRATGLFDAEPRAGLSLSQVEKLADEILNLE